MPLVNVPGYDKPINFPDTMSRQEIADAIKKNLQPKADLPPLLRGPLTSPSQTPKTEGQPSDQPQQGVMSRVGQGIAAGFGDSGVTKEEAARYPLVAGAKEAVELPGRVMGAGMGAVAGGAAGIAEKMGMLPERATKLMHELLETMQVGGMAAAPETKSTGISRPMEPPRAVARIPELPEQAITRRLGGDVVPREAAEEAGTAVQRKAGEMRKETTGLYEAAHNIPFAAKASAYEGLGSRFRSELGTDARNIVNEDTPAAGKMLDYLDKGISQFKITNKVGPELSRSMREDIDAINLRGIESVRVHLNELKRGAKNATDARIGKLIMDRWDEHLGDVVRQKLFTGDPKAVDTLLAARQSSHEYKKLFAGKDAVSKSFKMMADGEATPEKIAGFFWGADKIGGTDLPPKMWDQMVKLFGPDDPQLKAIRSAMWNYAKQRPRGARELYNSTIGRKMYDPTTLHLIDRYSQQQSDRANINDNILMHIGAGFVGRAVHHMLPVPGVGHAVTYGIKKLAQRKPQPAGYGGVNE